MTDPLSQPQVSRDFTVAVLVVHDGRVLLHWHRKLARWLPPGGHIEPGELPDEAALREVREETSVIATLLPARGLDLDAPGLPRQLCRPAGIQLENIIPGHQHIDLIYFATTDNPTITVDDDSVGWHGPDDWPALGLTEEVAAWCAAAVEAVRRSVPRNRGIDV
ncbi:MAG: NUDIX hydrolase [Thermomicrobiales bacterium]